MDWTVRVYDGEDDEIATWDIEDRTEHQAFEEAAADVARLERAADWSLTERV